MNCVDGCDFKPLWRLLRGTVVAYACPVHLESQLAQLVPEGSTGVVTVRRGARSAKTLVENIEEIREALNE